jgi:CDP-alcohol phosphatidyltransferase-like enzyme
MAERPLTEGERWARDELERLLAARFSPPAVARFLVASQRRAGEVRAARPELARRAWGWVALGGAAWVLLALAGVRPFRRRARAGLAWWALTAVMLDWHLGMVETEDGRPRQLGAADALTLFRCWLVPVALETPTPLVCGAAALSDVLDGRLARGGAPTRIGRDLEGLVDASFAAAALRAARRRELVGRAVVAAELARLGVGFGYALYVYFGQATAPDPGVTRAARMTTPVRAAGLIAAGLGLRRIANGLLAVGAAGSVAAVATALARGRR